MKVRILKIITLLFVFFLILISCKKDAFSFQEGHYIGVGHIEKFYWRSDYIPITPDSIIRASGDYKEVFFPVEVDTMFVDTAYVEIFNDSIMFNNGLRFPVNSENMYRKSYPGYTFYTFTIIGDTLLIMDDYVIDRGGPRPGGGKYTFKGIKQ